MVTRPGESLPLGLARAATEVYNTGMSTPTTAEVRAWARQRGFAVGDRGRLSPDLVAQYVAERGGTASGPPRQREAGRTNPPVRAASRAAAGGRPARGVVRARTPWNWPVLEQGGNGSRARSGG